jgi:uncharacterized protein YkwD
MHGAAATRRGPWSQARPSIRAGHNLTSFTANTQLRNAARARSSDMLANGYFEHDGLKETWDARIARYLKAPLTGEDIAWGSGSYGTPEGIVSQWMHSPTHRASSSPAASTASASASSPAPTTTPPAPSWQPPHGRQ